VTPLLSIALPAFDEEANVRAAFDAARAVIEPGVRGSVEWLLVDDGSRDGTGAQMAELVREYPNVRRLAHPARRGLGAAIWTALAAARGELFTWLPADGQVDPSVIVEMVERARTADLVMLMREEQTREAQRRAMTLGMYVLFRVLLGFDPYGFSGIFLARRGDLAAVTLTCTSGVQNYAVVIQAMRRQQRIARITTVIGKRMSGHSKVANLRTTFRVLGDILGLRARMTRAR
jgi:glycosyltransferase involved in cell wall biosynthesis